MGVPELRLFLDTLELGDAAFLCFVYVSHLSSPPFSVLDSPGALNGWQAGLLPGSTLQPLPGETG
jgi:hypothetical protein